MPKASISSNLIFSHLLNIYHKVGCIHLNTTVSGLIKNNDRRKFKRKAKYNADIL